MARAGPMAARWGWPSTAKGRCWWPMTWAMWSGGSALQKVQQRVVEHLRVRGIEPVRCTRHPDHQAVRHGPVGEVARSFNRHDGIGLAMDHQRGHRNAAQV